jgi:hypothetical protein
VLPRQLPVETKENHENIPSVVIQAEIQTWHLHKDKSEAHQLASTCKVFGVSDYSVDKPRF